MLDRDGRTEQQVIAAIDWSQADDFWRSNILSMPTLREQYERLRLQAQRGRTPPNGRHQTYRNPENQDAYDEELRVQ